MPQDSFTLVKLEEGRMVPVCDGDGQLIKFKSGTEADTEAKRLSVSLGTKVQPRRINDTKWRERETKRLTDGTYRPLPWANEKWWTELQPLWKDHFPHVSLQKQALIAFTEGDEKGAADIQTPIKPGRYLEKFFSEKLDEYNRRDLCAVLASKFESHDLMFTDDPEEVEEIYTTGPNSCMSKAAKDYGVKEHPVRAYLAGDLQLAYLHRKGRVVARCMVFAKKKLYNRIYGDTALMKPILSKAGFSAGPPIGARIKKIVHGDEMGEFCYVVPHIDDANLLQDAGEFLVVTNNNDKGTAISIGSGNGRTEQLCRCPMCTASRAKGRMTAFTYRNKSQMACQECAKKDAFQCPILGTWVHNSEAVEVNMGKRKMTVGRGCISRGLVFKCEGDGLWWHNDDRIVLQDGRTWSRTYAKTHAVECTSCGMMKDKIAECSCPKATPEPGYSTQKVAW